METAVTSNLYGNFYFWRTYDGQEIDLVEEIDNTLDCFEFKWFESRRPKIPKDWARHYGDASHTVIHRENYLDFVL